MNGIAFGKELKRLRNKAGISSKVLSTKVGKAVTYVSQLENGKIKNPDFDTCFKLLKELGLEESKIEPFLDYYGIVSSEREQAELEWAIQQAELKAQKEDEKYQLNWYGKLAQRLENENDKLHGRLNFFIGADLSRAESVITNMVALTEDEEKFEFFCSLFEHNYAGLGSKNREQLLRLINEFVREKQTEQSVEFFSEEDKEDLK